MNLVCVLKWGIFFQKSTPKHCSSLFFICLHLWARRGVDMGDSVPVMKTWFWIILKKSFWDCNYELDAVLNVLSDLIQMHVLMFTIGDPVVLIHKFNLFDAFLICDPILLFPFNFGKISTPSSVLQIYFMMAIMQNLMSLVWKRKKVKLHFQKSLSFIFIGLYHKKSRIFYIVISRSSTLLVSQ